MVAAALLTGTWLFATGGTAARLVAVVHGVLGLSLLVLSPVKRRTVAAGLARARRSRWASLTLLVLAAVTVTSGLVHAAGVRTVVGVPMMHLHVVAAIATGVLTTWHAIARPARPVRTDRSRQGLLRAAAVGVAAGFGYVVVDRSVRLLDWPGAQRRGTGSHEVGSFDPQAMPRTIWFTDAVPHLDRQDHRVLIDGHPTPVGTVFSSVTWTATLDCTSGWYATQEWGGTPLADLLGPPPAEAGSIAVVSVTGYHRRFPVADLDRLLIATTVGGLPLSDGHGGPARLVAPDRRGFWWVKWVGAVGYEPTPHWAQPPFPLR